jgi:hypothetical protein
MLLHLHNIVTTTGISSCGLGPCGCGLSIVVQLNLFWAGQTPFIFGTLAASCNLLCLPFLTVHNHG